LAEPLIVLRVLVVADDPLARAGLAALLGGRPECTIVGQVDGVALADQVLVHRPDVIAWDLGWSPAPDSSTLDLEEVDTPAVALLPDEEYAADAWAAGARGLLLRDADVENLVAALSAVAQGLVVLDPTLTITTVPFRESSPRPPVEELTPRELEVLQLLAEGLPNKSIAGRLNISEHTVKFHVNAILGKLDVRSRTEAVVHATRLGLIIL
jgi:DNA-binding NarL/FixJ family response regulator